MKYNIKTNRDIRFSKKQLHLLYDMLTGIKLLQVHKLKIRVSEFLNLRQSDLILKDPKLYGLNIVTLESNMFGSIIHYVIHTIRKDIKNILGFYLKNLLLTYIQKSRIWNYKITSLIVTTITKWYSLFSKTIISLIFIIQHKYPLFYSCFIVLYSEYYSMLNGNLSKSHIYLFLILGFYCSNADYFYWFIVMLLSNKIGCYLPNSSFNHQYPKTTNFVTYIVNIIYLLSITMCINIIFNYMILPCFSKILSMVKGFWNGFVNMMGQGSQGEESGNNNPHTPNQNPNPNRNPKNVMVSSKKKGKQKVKDSDEFRPQAHLDTRDAYIEYLKAVDAFYLEEKKNFNDKVFRLGYLMNDYSKYLSPLDKDKLNDIINTETPKFKFHANDDVHEFWKNKRMTNKAGWEQTSSIFRIFEANSKSIQTQLGGKTSGSSTAFRNELETCKLAYSSSFKNKESIIKTQLASSRKTDKLFKDNGVSLAMLLEKKGILPE